MMKTLAKKVYLFVYEVYVRMRDNELVDMANALTFKLILSVFPFIICIMSSVAFFNLDVSTALQNFLGEAPDSVRDILMGFIGEVTETKRVSLLSTSLLVSFFSASSGVYTFMKGINRAYNAKERRGYILQRFISLLVVIIFAALIVVSLYVYIFSDKINELVFGSEIHLPVIVINLRSYIITYCLTFIMIMAIYMLSVVERPKIRQLVPGAIFTMVAWLGISKCFNIYINNFSRYSAIYGSIGAVFVFALWLNLLSYVLLIGGQINAICYDRKWIEEVLVCE